MDEFQSTTHGHGSSTSLSYQTYYDLLINACARYDKTKKANIGKGRNVYNTTIDSYYDDYPTDVIDYVPDSFHGGIDLPPDEFYQIKGDGKLNHHLGADYFEDPDGTFVSQPKKYIDKLGDTYKRLFNDDPPNSYKTPLDKNDLQS